MGVLALWRLGSFGYLWDITLGGIIIVKTNQVNRRMANQGDGFSCGMSLRVVGNHQFLA